MSCLHMRQREDGEVADPGTKEGLLPCACPGCEDGALGDALDVFRVDGTVQRWRRISTGPWLPWMWARITGTAKIKGIE